jgi:hypothetical protein
LDLILTSLLLYHLSNPVPFRVNSTKTRLTATSSYVDSPKSDDLLISVNRILRPVPSIELTIEHRPESMINRPLSEFGSSLANCNLVSSIDYFLWLFWIFAMASILAIVELASEVTDFSYDLLVTFNDST